MTAAVEHVSRADRRGEARLLGAEAHRPFYIKDPLSTLACSPTAGGPGCFTGNVIPSNRINPVGQKLAGYYPTPDSQVDTGASNFSMTDLLPSQAYQWSTKIDHHFNNAVALNGFVLRQVTHEANANYNPTNRFVGGSYQLDRTINTVVVNNTYIVNPSTVLTLRGGYNKFNDNYNLPQAFDAAALLTIRRSRTRCRIPTGSRRSRSPATRAPAGPTARRTATTSTARTAP
jgi:hypothetical protein